MQCFAELLSPSAVTHALSLPFLSKSANNVVIVKTSLLQIYSFKSVIQARLDSSSGIEHPTSTLNFDIDGKQNLTSARAERTQFTKLVLVGEYELSGTVTSLGRIKLPRSKSGGDALLIASRDSKISLTEWDPDRYCVSTISIHYYERDDLQGSPWDPPLSQCRSHLAVDPRSRCAALKFGKRSVAILPFHQGGDDLAMEDVDGEGDAEVTGKERDKTAQHATTPYAASFVLSLLALDPQLTQPIDLKFLHEFREPTFGILYSHGGSSNALLHDRRDIVSYALFTLDLDQRASTALITVDNLPYDLWSFIPLRLPIGGALLLGYNEVIHVDESGKAFGLAVNEIAKASTNFSLQDNSDLELRLENCVVEQLGWQSDEVAIITENGQLAILTFNIDGRQISGLSIRLAPQGPEGSVVPAQPTCVAMVGRGRMLVGSQSDDAKVLGWSRSTDKAKRQRATVDADMDLELEGSDLEGIDFDDDEDDLYSSAKVAAPAEAIKAPRLEDDLRQDGLFRVHDRSLNLGPMRGIALTKRPDISQDPHSDLRLVATNGHAQNGRLSILGREINIEESKVQNLSSVSQLWTLQPEAPGPSSTSNLKDHFVIANLIDDGSNSTSHTFRISQAGMDEVKDSDLDPDAGASIEVGFLINGTRVAQVLATEVRFYEKGESSLRILDSLSLYSPRESSFEDAQNPRNLHS